MNRKALLLTAVFMGIGFIVLRAQPGSWVLGTKRRTVAAQSKNKLTFRASVEKDTYLVGELVIVRLEVINSSAHSIYVAEPDQYADTIGWVLHCGKHPAQKLSGRDMDRIAVQLFPSDYGVNLAPAQACRSYIILDISSPGMYDLTCGYSTLGYPANKYSRVWRGSLKAGPIRFEARKPSGAELVCYRNWMECFSQTGATIFDELNCLQGVFSQSPNSPYRDAAFRRLCLQSTSSRGTLPKAFCIIEKWGAKSSGYEEGLYREKMMHLSASYSASEQYDLAEQAARKMNNGLAKYRLIPEIQQVRAGLKPNPYLEFVQESEKRRAQAKSRQEQTKEQVAALRKARIAMEARYREEWKQVDQRVRDLGGPITEFEQHLMRPQEEINEQVRVAQLRKEVHDGMGDLTTDKVKTNGALWFELTTAELKKVVEHREANKKRVGLSQDELKNKRSALASDRDIEAIKLEGELIRSGGRFTEEENKLLRSDKEKAAEIERAYQAGELHGDFSPLTSYSTDKLETRISYQMKLNLDDLKKVKKFRDKKE